MKKKLALLGMLLMLLGNVYAQKGKQAIGFGLSYGTEIENLGLGLKYQYNITNPIRLEPSINYFFENDNVSMLDLNVNFHYLFPVASNFKLYPLVGLTFSNWMFDFGDSWLDDDFDLDDNECRFGMNLGAGGELSLNRNWAFNFEFRYQLVSDFDQVLSASELLTASNALNMQNC